MGISSGPNIAHDSLVVYVDTANVNSYVGEPTVNLIGNPYFINGVTGSSWTLTRYPYGTIGSNDYINVNNNILTMSHQGGYDNTQTFITQTVTGLITGSTYTYSIWCYSNSISSSIANLDIKSGSIWLTKYYSTTGSWQVLSSTFVAQEDTVTPRMGIYQYFSNGDNVAYFKNPQFEMKDHVTPFINGTRPSILYDISGKKHNGILTNMSYDINGNILYIGTGSFGFGNGSYINFGKGSLYFPIPNLTVEVWAKTAGLGAGMTQGGLMCLTYGCYLSLTSTGILMSVFDSSSQKSISQNYSRNMYDGAWHCYNMTLDGIYRNLYIDGIFATSSTAPWTGQTNWPNNALEIGNNSNDNKYFLSGSIAIAKLYNRALSTQEIKRNYDAEKKRFGLS